MDGFWKRWFARRVNAFSFWFVLAVVALSLVMAARLLVPPGQRPPSRQPSPPAASPR